MSLDMEPYTLNISYRAVKCTMCDGGREFGANAHKTQNRIR